MALFLALVTGMGRNLSLVINLLLTYVSAPLLNSDQLLSYCQLQALPQEEKRSDRYLVQRFMFAQENDLFEYDFVILWPQTRS